MTQAAPPQRTPAYYTEVHGAGALAQYMHTMGRLDPKYHAVRDKAIAVDKDIITLGE